MTLKRKSIDILPRVNKGIFISEQSYTLIKEIAQREKRTLKSQMDIIIQYYIESHEK